MNSAFLQSKLAPKQYYRQYIKTHAGTRPNQRSPNQTRPISTLSKNYVGKCDESMCLVVGESVFVCGVRVEVFAPPLTPSNSKDFICGNDNEIVCNVTLASGCSPSIRAGPPTPLAQTITHKLSTLLNSLQKMGILRIPKCNVKETELAWCLFVDVYVVCDGGGVLCGAAKAVLECLDGLVLPALEIVDDRVYRVQQDSCDHPSNNDNNSMNDDNDNRTVRLATKLECQSWFLFRDNERDEQMWMVDGDWREEECWSGDGSIWCVYEQESKRIVFSQVVAADVNTVDLSLLIENIDGPKDAAMATI